jgi:hypothetical protein
MFRLKNNLPRIGDPDVLGQKGGRDPFPIQRRVGTLASALQAGKKLPEKGQPEFDGEAFFANQMIQSNTRHRLTGHIDPTIHHPHLYNLGHQGVGEMGRLPGSSEKPLDPGNLPLCSGGKNLEAHRCAEPLFPGQTCPTHTGVPPGRFAGDGKMPESCKLTHGLPCCPPGDLRPLNPRLQRVPIARI